MDDLSTYDYRARLALIVVLAVLALGGFADLVGLI